MQIYMADNILYEYRSYKIILIVKIDVMGLAHQ
jgi:hypothetical protein